METLLLIQEECGLVFVHVAHFLSFCFCLADVRRRSFNNYNYRCVQAVVQAFMELCNKNWWLHILRYKGPSQSLFYSFCMYKVFYILTVSYCNSSVIFIRLFSGQNVVSVTWEMWQWMILPSKIVPLCSCQADLAHQRNSHVPTSTASQRIICVIS